MLKFIDFLNSLDADTKLINTLIEGYTVIFENSKIDLKKLKTLVDKFRKEQEDYYDWKNDKECFKGMCQSVTKELVDYLNKNGFDARRVNGKYYDYNDNFIPNMSEWSEEDKEDWEKDPGMNHWWVEVGPYKIDITRDQFHPGEEIDYRVIIESLNTIFTESITDNENFKKWFEGSKAVDNNGNPLVVYHGTKKDFSEFNSNARGRYDVGKLGYFFTANPDIAAMYAKGKGGSITPVYISLQNPLIEGIKRLDRFEDIDDIVDYVEEARSSGHDGIIFLAPGDADEYVVFESNQIKSIHNKGSFNSNSNNILENQSFSEEVWQMNPTRFDIDDEIKFEEPVYLRDRFNPKQLKIIGKRLIHGIIKKFNETSGNYTIEIISSLGKDMYPKGLKIIRNKRTIERNKPLKLKKIPSFTTDPLKPKPSTDSWAKNYENMY